MTDINNMFVSGGTDVITLSVYNRKENYDEENFLSNQLVTSYVPGEKLPPLGHPFKPIPEEGLPEAEQRPQTAPIEINKIKGLSVLQMDNRDEWRKE